MVLCAYNPSYLGDRGRQENCLKWGGWGYSEPRKYHCTPAWVMEWDWVSKNKKGLCRWDWVKAAEMGSISELCRWVLNATTCILLKRQREIACRQKRRQWRDHGSKDRSEVATSQGIRNWKRYGADSPPEPANALILAHRYWILASRTVRKSISTVLSHWVGGNQL